MINQYDTIHLSRLLSFHYDLLYTLDNALNIIRYCFIVNLGTPHTTQKRVVSIIYILLIHFTEYPSEFEFYFEIHLHNEISI